MHFDRLLDRVLVPTTWSLPQKSKRIAREHASDMYFLSTSDLDNARGAGLAGATLTRGTARTRFNAMRALVI